MVVVCMIHIAVVYMKVQYEVTSRVAKQLKGFGKK